MLDLEKLLMPNRGFRVTLGTKGSSPDMLGAVWEHQHVCYDDKTEVFTDAGWKYFRDLKPFDCVATVDINNQSSRFDRPTEIHSYKFDGDLYQIKRRGLDLLVTPDHRMVVSDVKFQGWRFTSAKEIYGKDSCYLKTTINNNSYCKIEALGLDSVTLAKLVGFYLGDGFKVRKEKNVLGFQLLKKRKIEYLNNLDLCVHKGASNSYWVRHDGISQWFKENCFNSKGEKIIPDCYLRSDPSTFANLLDGLINSDGSIDPRNNSVRFFNTSADLVDRLQGLLHMNGMACEIKVVKPSKHRFGVNQKECYSISVQKVVDRIRVEHCPSKKAKQQRESWVRYSGIVYCVTVTDGALLVRRNGTVIVSGNCVAENDFELDTVPSGAWNAIEREMRFGHWDILSGASASVSFVGFPHAAAMQWRTHQDTDMLCQSMRFTGKRFQKNIDEIDLSEVFYQYPWILDLRTNHSATDHFLRQSILLYQQLIKEGCREEDARNYLASGYRQDFHIHGTLQDWMHVLDRRLMTDTQAESRCAAAMAVQALHPTFPELWDWYLKNRAGKNNLSP